MAYGEYLCTVSINYECTLNLLNIFSCNSDLEEAGFEATGWKYCALPPELSNCKSYKDISKDRLLDWACFSGKVKNLDFGLKMTNKEIYHAKIKPICI